MYSARCALTRSAAIFPVLRFAFPKSKAAPGDALEKQDIYRFSMSFFQI